MSYKDLLVVLDSETASRERMRLAATLAERFAAHLVGLYPLPLPEVPRHFGYYDPALLDPFFRELREKSQELSDKEREAFEHAASLSGLSAEWRAVEAGMESDTALHARYVDLTILGQLDPDRGDADLIRPRPEHVTLASGRPVLVVPYAGHFETVGRRVLIGWNATREATRAVNDAMPLADRGRRRDRADDRCARGTRMRMASFPVPTSRCIWRATVSRPRSSAPSRPASRPATCCCRAPPTSAPIYW